MSVPQPASPSGTPSNDASRLLFYAIGASVLLAIPTGLLLGDTITRIDFIGDMFLNALKLIIVPLVMASIIMGVSSLGDVRKLGKLGATTVGYYAMTTFFAVLTGLVMVNIIQPGVGTDIAAAVVPDRAVGKSFSFIDVLTGMISPNLFKSMAETEVLPLIIFSLVFGGILTTLGEKGQRVLSVVDGLNEAMMKMVHLIMWTAPVGIFALVSARLGEAVAAGNFKEEMVRLGLYSLTVIAGLAVHAFITLPFILRVFARRSPILYFRGLADVLLTAFSTASSSATLPLTIRATEENNKVSPQAASFVLPLGATINMDGTALYEAVAAVFIAQAFGIDLTIGQQVLVAITATLASIGAAGIPEAGLVTMILVLNAVGLPLEGLGAILAVDWILDRFRTTVNVWGDACGAGVIDRVALNTLPEVARTSPPPETSPAP